ncbi:hypothetical protein D4740_04590 [Actinomyces sp. 2119]|uniref:hypothetical protein n=1 Tax=Actinomyces sp. 2119 TaxID=2321393 RepID=UPI000E6C2AA7|nr:hypothetical protein [Actinomyces sp. 2119]RJF43147.1 hypothetical protein D4740_04590 [Actinomyces sp. 2119]
MVLDSVVDEASHAAADPNNPDPQISTAWVAVAAVALANIAVNVNVAANANVLGAGADAPVLADRSSQYSVVADRSFFSSAAARDLGEAGLSENRVRALVRNVTRQQEISPAADGSVVLTYPYHGRTLELVGRVEGPVLYVTDGSLTTQDTHATVQA